MKSIKYIFLLLSFVNLNAQDDLGKTLFNNLFKNRTYKITYTEYKFHDLDKIKNTIKQATIVHKMQLELSPYILLDSLVFTNQELENLYNEIVNSNDKHWARNLITNGEYIKRKKVDKILKSPLKGWKYFHEKYDEYLYTFSKPVFIRNNTVCFFYSSIGNGDLGGFGSFNIYIKQNGEWIYFNSLSLWIS